MWRAAGTSDCRSRPAIPFLAHLVPILFIWSFAEAKDFQLFANSQQVSDYNAKIIALRATGKTDAGFSEPTFLVFSNGTRIQVTRVLGEGGLTTVFLRADGRALRVPKASGTATWSNGSKTVYTDGMISWWKSYPHLEHTGATIRTYYGETESRPPEFITVGFFGAKFDIREFETDPWKLVNEGKINKSDIPLLGNKLEAFVRSFAGYKAIGDFKYQQVTSDGKDWKLLDCSGFSKATSVNDGNPFDHPNMKGKLPEVTNKWIHDVIAHERQINPGAIAVNCLEAGLKKSLNR